MGKAFRLTWRVPESEDGNVKPWYWGQVRWDYLRHRQVYSYVFLNVVLWAAYCTWLWAVRRKRVACEDAAWQAGYIAGSQSEKEIQARKDRAKRVIIK